jgi:hypothetical protein
MNDIENVYVINSKKDTFSPVLTKARGKDEYCITASTDPDKVKFDNFFILSMTFQELKKNIPDNIGILLVTDSGGQYISSISVSKNI